MKHTRAVWRVISLCVASVALLLLGSCKGYGGGGAQPPPDRTTGDRTADSCPEFLKTLPERPNGQYSDSEVIGLSFFPATHPCSGYNTRQVTVTYWEQDPVSGMWVNKPGSQIFDRYCDVCALAGESLSPKQTSRPRHIEVRAVCVAPCETAVDLQEKRWRFTINP